MRLRIALKRLFYRQHGGTGFPGRVQSLTPQTTCRSLRLASVPQRVVRHPFHVSDGMMDVSPGGPFHHNKGFNTFCHCHVCEQACTIESR